MNSPEHQKRTIAEHTTRDVQADEESLVESDPKHEMDVSLNTFLESAVAQKLFSRTLEHPEWGALIAWAPTEWVAELANPHPLADTNTGGADGLPDRRVDLATLFEDMLTHGMRDPFILGIGLDKRTRLETGNQRIQCALRHGVAFVPVISYVNDTAITNSENGKHQGLLLELNETALASSYKQYIQPSTILTRAPLASLSL